jgi:polygalacturonase
MKRISYLLILGMLIFSRTWGIEISIRDTGAIPDSVSLNTKAIQTAIDKCHQTGGGTVKVPAGIYLTGTIFLRDNVCLELQAGAELRGSTDISDYPEIKRNRALVYAYKTENASLQGNGTINGQGKFFTVKDNAPNRPFLVLIDSCFQIRISGVKLKNSAMWNLRLFGGSDIYVTGISIYSHCNFNNDGIDIDSKNVIISDCFIDCDDDALCLKSDRNVPCENVTVTNCVLASNCNLIKMGTASFGGFKNITISNCVLRRASESNLRDWDKTIKGITDSITGISGIALEIVDGGHMDQINISDIIMEGVQTPVFIRLGSRRNATGSMKNIQISNVIANNYSLIPSIISGVPGFYIENVKINNCIFNCMGKGEIYSHDIKIPEAEKGYPENRMFGHSLPAFGFFIRHVRGIQLVNLQFNLLNRDNRPAIWMEEGNSIYADNIVLSGPFLSPDAFFFRNVSNAWIQGFRSETPPDNFLYIDGENSSGIRLTNNDFSRVKKISTAGSAIKKKNIVTTMGNIRGK